MRMYDIIKKKRDNKELCRKEIEFFVNGYVKDCIPDYQVSALLMAVFLRGMSLRETITLTQCMQASGEQIDLSAIPGIKVDKHSTGGVGDKTTIVLAPLMAAAGLPVAKMSGRGLGHTGGTIDKLKAIPNFRTELTKDELIDNVSSIGLAITGQTGDIAAADRKIYALRDVTATVDSIPLIASSIMSKKLASGADRILLDVKVGKGAFMKNLEDAAELAEMMVHIGNAAGKRTMAVISDMDQPLGNAVGNALEIKEAISVLKGEGPEDVFQLCRELGALLLMLGEKAKNPEQGRCIIDHMIYSGKALEKLSRFVRAQDGEPGMVEQPDKVLPIAKEQVAIRADRDGYIESLNAEKIGLGAMLLGAGRSKIGDSIDPAVGVVVDKKIGMTVKEKEVIALLHINEHTNLPRAVELIKSAVSIIDKPVQTPELIKNVLQ